MGKSLQQWLATGRKEHQKLARESYLLIMPITMKEISTKVRPQGREGLSGLAKIFTLARWKQEKLKDKDKSL